jgi:hypothetical protein
MAIDILLAGRAGSGVAMDARALDTRAVAWRRGVVDGQAQAACARQARLDGLPGGDGEPVTTPADGEDRMVGAAKVVGDAGAAEPRGGGAPAAREENTQE